MLMFLFRCLWPLGSMTCPTQSCWTSSRSLRGWAKSITSTQSSSNKGPQANFVWLFHLSSEQTGVQKSKKKKFKFPQKRRTSQAPAITAHQNTDCFTAARAIKATVPHTKPRSPWESLWWHFDGIDTATSWSDSKLSASCLPRTSWCEWMDERMNECLMAFLQPHWTFSRVNKEEVCSHDSSGPGYWT